MSILEVNNLHVAYGPVVALRGINVQVEKGSIVTLLGSNGAGKSTFINTISAVVKQKDGSILFKGKELSRKMDGVVRNGIVQVPEGRKIFGGLTVLDNLKLGAYLSKDNSKIKKDLGMVFDLFPILGNRQQQQAGTLSGGEQQMLAIGRGLMANPEILMLDEPSLGLAPVLINEVFRMILEIKKIGITILLVEQNAKKALNFCDYAYVLENGKVVMEGLGVDLCNNEKIKKAYLAA